MSQRGTIAIKYFTPSGLSIGQPHVTLGGKGLRSVNLAEKRTLGKNHAEKLN